MATQNCPRCKSGRIRLGYRHTSIFQKMMFRYNLLCNDCNWEFIGFAIPGTVTTKDRRKKKTSFTANEKSFRKDSDLENNKIDAKLISQLESNNTNESLNIEKDAENIEKANENLTSTDLIEENKTDENLTSTSLIEENKAESLIIKEDNPKKKNKVKKRVRIRLI